MSRNTTRWRSMLCTETRINMKTGCVIWLNILIETQAYGSDRWGIKLLKHRLAEGQVMRVYSSWNPYTRKEELLKWECTKLILLIHSLSITDKFKIETCRVYGIVFTTDKYFYLFHLACSLHSFTYNSLFLFTFWSILPKLPICRGLFQSQNSFW